MKHARNIVSTLLLVLASNLLLFGAGQRKPEYKSGSATFYFIDENGKTSFLLGKEQRSAGPFWYNFGGKKDQEDASMAAQLSAKGKISVAPSLITAMREGVEETAQVIDLVELEQGVRPKPFYMSINPPFFVQETEPNKDHSVGYFFRVKEKVDPKVIKEAAKKLGSGAHVEKFDWKWVDAEEFVDWINKTKGAGVYKGLDAPIYQAYALTLQNSAVRKYIAEIIEQGKREAKIRASQIPTQVIPAKKSTVVQKPVMQTTVAKAACIVPYSWNPTNGSTWILLSLKKDSNAAGGYSWQSFCLENTEELDMAHFALQNETAGKVSLLKVGHNPAKIKQGLQTTYIVPATFEDSQVIAKECFGKLGIESFDWKWVAAKELTNPNVLLQSHLPGAKSYGLSASLKKLVEEKAFQEVLAKKMAEGAAWAKKR